MSNHEYMFQYIANKYLELNDTQIIAIIDNMKNKLNIDLNADHKKGTDNLLIDAFVLDSKKT